MLVEEFVRPALTIRHTASAAKARAFAEYAPQTVSAPAAEGGFGGSSHARFARSSRSADQRVVASVAGERHSSREGTRIEPIVAGSACELLWPVS